MIQITHVKCIYATLIVSTHAVHHNVLCMMNLIIKTLDIPLAKDKISLK